MKTQGFKSEILISNLWIFVLFNIIFRDLHQFGDKDFLSEALGGTINGMVITDELMMLGAILAEIPIAMVLLSRILRPKTNKILNTIAVIITSGVLISAMPYADMDDVFHFLFEIVALMLILWIVWKRKPSTIETSHNK
jgi:hypothetical protein